MLKNQLATKSIVLQNTMKKKDNKKIARTRRQRGYHWEDTLVKRFSALDEWEAFRLGSPSIALPDVLSVNNKRKILFTIEAKSGTGNTLQVPFDQIERCLKWCKTFDIYKTKKVIMAFKFLSKKRIGLGQYENRELREFYKEWDESLEIRDCVCTYEGTTYMLENKKRIPVKLKDSKMPFKTRKLKC